jgi:hypothetical protein
VDDLAGLDDRPGGEVYGLGLTLEMAVVGRELGAAVDRADPSTGVQNVIAGTAQDHVRWGVAVDDVVVRAAGDVLDR